MGSLQALLAAWRTEAETLDRRYGADQLARLCWTHATELETALREGDSEAVTLKAASEACGYSVSHLRRLMDSGAVPNVGRTGAPRVRLADLPYKLRRMPPGAPAQSLQFPRAPKPGVRRIGVR